jgi:hypothetical protein
VVKLPDPEPVAVVAAPVEVPSPERLGIQLAEPAVNVPPPDKLGIKLE